MTHNDTFPGDENDQEINLPGQSNEYDPNMQFLDEDSDRPENPIEPDTPDTEEPAPVDETIPSEIKNDSVPEKNPNYSKLDSEYDTKC